MQKMKILFTLVDLNIGGVQKTLINILNNFDYNKYIVDILLLEKNIDFSSLLPENVNIIYAKDYISNFDKRSFLYRFNKNICIKKILKSYKNKFNLNYDVSIAFNGFNNYSDLIACAVNAKKKIIWVHNDFYNVIKYSNFNFLYKLMYKKMGEKFKYFDNIAVVCDEVANSFNDLYDNKYYDKIKVVNNYIDVQEIKQKSEILSDVLLSNNFNIISVGRLCKAKNFELLINITKKLIDSNFKVCTYIIGDGEEKIKLSKLIKKYNLEKNVILLGKMINPYSVIKQADLFISSSLYESFANSIIESLLLGVPVISSNTSGARNIIKNIADDNTCFIFNDENDLYNLIVEKINNRNKIKCLSLNSYNKKVMNSIYELLS